MGIGVVGLKIITLLITLLFLAESITRGGKERGAHFILVYIDLAMPVGYVFL
jgi:hypothetical protein